MFADIARTWQENWRRREIGKSCNSIVRLFVTMYATANYAVAFLSLAVIRTYRVICELYTDRRSRRMNGVTDARKKIARVTIVFIWNSGRVDGSIDQMFWLSVANERVHVPMLRHLKYLMPLLNYLSYIANLTLVKIITIFDDEPRTTKCAA